ncbi:MAG: hypothetical protein ACK2UC_08600 [Anaerolineae bacterium]|jgi:hypothetical protein
MNQKTRQGLRITFLAYFVIGGLVGLQHLLAPRLWADLAGMEIAETVTWRLIGAALIGFAVGSWLAFREPVWERVRIVVFVDLVWSALGALVILWGLLFEGLPPLEWLNAILLAAFAVAFTVFYLRSRYSDAD